MNCRSIDKKYNQRLGNCPECGRKHWYNIRPFRVDGYTIKWKMFKDHQRQKYAKELLQPIDSKGKRNEDFYNTYGDPTKQANPDKIGINPNNRKE